MLADYDHTRGFIVHEQPLLTLVTVTVSRNEGGGKCQPNTGEQIRPITGSS